MAYHAASGLYCTKVTQRWIGVSFDGYCWTTVYGRKFIQSAKLEGCDVGFIWQSWENHIPASGKLVSGVAGCAKLTIGRKRADLWCLKENDLDFNFWQSLPFEALLVYPLYFKPALKTCVTKERTFNQTESRKWSRYLQQRRAASRLQTAFVLRESEEHRKTTLLRRKNRG